MILNGMIFKDHIIQYMIHFLSLGSVLGPRDSFLDTFPQGRISDTHPCAENMNSVPEKFIAALQCTIAHDCSCLDKSFA